MTVVMLVMGLVALESRMVAGERCTLGQHREMQVAFTRSSIIAWWYCARCVVGKIIQVSLCGKVLQVVVNSQTGCYITPLLMNHDFSKFVFVRFSNWLLVQHSAET